MHWIMGESCWNASRKSGHAIAKHVGVDDKTVAGWRVKTYPTAEIPQMTADAKPWLQAMLSDGSRINAA
jgi:hypothetical protein